MKRSQNPDGGFRYMLQGIATSEFPRSAAGVVALQSAGEYDSKEVRDGIAYLRQLHAGVPAGAAESSFFLRAVLCGPGDVAAGGERLDGMVHGDPRRSDPAGNRRRDTGRITACATSTARRWR